jgi:hypothetical protein
MTDGGRLLSDAETMAAHPTRVDPFQPVTSDRY